MVAKHPLILSNDPQTNNLHPYINRWLNLQVHATSNIVKTPVLRDFHKQLSNLSPDTEGLVMALDLGWMAIHCLLLESSKALELNLSSCSWRNTHVLIQSNGMMTLNIFSPAPRQTPKVEEGIEFRLKYINRKKRSLHSWAYLATILMLLQWHATAW
jgi:hypothetical protein